MSKPSGIQPERLARALGLLALILAEDGARIPVSSITAELAMSREEIEEDVSLLNLVNFGGGTYLLYAQLEGDELVVERDLGADNMASPARLSPSLARSVLLALDLVGHVLPLEPGEADGLKRKLAKVLGTPEAATTQAGSLTPAAPEVLEVLASAVQEHRVTRIDYYSPARDELAERDVEPYELRNTGEAWYLEAFCLRSRSVRTFRADRIRSARLLATVFTSKPKMPGEGKSDSSGAKGSKAHWATVRQPEERAPLLSEQEIAFERTGEKEVLAHVPYFENGWLVGEILADLGRSVVEEPAEVIQSVIEAARSVLQTYTDEREWI